MSNSQPKKSVLNSTLAGAVAGTAELLVMQPTDVIKTRFQSLRVASHYQNGIFKAFQQVIKEEGFAALYRGTIPVLCIVGPRVSLQYMGLALYKPLFERMEGTILPSHSSAGLAGICTGITQAVTLVTPLEQIKVRQQTDLMNQVHERKYRGLFHTASLIVKEGGLPALYNGLLATVARQSWGLVVKFNGYLEIKAMFERASPDPEQTLAPWKHMVSGGLANVLVGVLNSPPDVVKTRMQDDSRPYRSTWDCVKSMARNEGYLSFFRGSWLRVIRIAPGGAIQFAVYEQVSAWLEKNKRTQ
ncbi:succinate fumarate mitochondrial transporter [Lichtheimia corymbifera JMRC:FSU:9682]|uniref:Succinate fumarate mitochondrial transporter n=1 Tax=Lichtheimia corymbifera JMRC:FSU:9682 TaxID=1263082 RepID=A0A068S3T2_9FUNG|nr:succinate fumarate mitochondrial transporter [Lichtheimia corymbifera JMRC:FSU:9682]